MRLRRREAEAAREQERREQERREYREKLERAQAQAAEVLARGPSIEDFIGGQPEKKKGPKKGPRSTSPKKLEELVVEVERRARSGDWEDAGPSMLAALYVWCHRRVYKIDPALRGKDFSVASMLAGRFVRDELAGDLPLAVAFVRWTWAREAAREKRRAAGDDFRISVRYQFSAKLYASYRLERRRAGDGGESALG